jgi:serine phosphatase RsbU (regulator of sigma subunit)
MIHEGSYYNPRFFLIGLSFVPLVVFDLRQRTALMISLTLNLGILVLYNPLHRWAGASPENNGLGDVDLTFVSVASSSAAAAIVLGMIFLKRANFRFENRISDLLKKTSHQNDELTAGIRYARKLQESILSKDVICGAANDQAALFLKPKDVLSGDFYYCEERSGKIVIGVVDCTGHGVPGAFVSIMAYRALRAAVEADEMLNPATILDLTNVQFQKEFNTSQSQMNDGMDVSLCIIDPVAKTVDYAGARGLLFLWQNNQLHTLDVDRRSIGEPSIHAFHRHHIKYNSGDMLFLSSDGFPDQFGGLGDKKFGKPRFRKLLSELANYPVNIIASRLTHVLQEWKGDTEQTDDICLVAFRLK